MDAEDVAQRQQSDGAALFRHHHHRCVDGIGGGTAFGVVAVSAEAVFLDFGQSDILAVHQRQIFAAGVGDDVRDDEAFCLPRQFSLQAESCRLRRGRIRLNGKGGEAFISRLQEFRPSGNERKVALHHVCLVAEGDLHGSAGGDGGLICHRFRGNRRDIRQLFRYDQGNQRQKQKNNPCSHE